jgi:hypothetical protein
MMPSLRKRCERGPSWPSSLCMATVLKVLLEFLRILRLARDYVQHFPGRWASLVAFLGRKLGALFRYCGLERPGTLRSPKPSKPPYRGSGARAYSVSGGPGVSKEYVVVAASTVPDSANYASAQDTGRHTATVSPTPAVGIPAQTLASLSIDQLHAGNPPTPFERRSLAHRSSGNLSAVSIQSRASSRFSIITNSRESTRAPALGQPSRLPRATHRQFGRGPDPSRSRDRPSRPPTPTTRPHTPYQFPHLEIITSNPPHFAYDDGRVSPVVQPSVSSHAHEPLSPPPMDGNQRKQSSTSVVIEFENPSTESLPLSSVNPPQLTEEPFTIDTTTAHSSPVTAAADFLDEEFPTASLPEDLLPEGRFVQLINSDQVPRYTKNITMQVGSIIVLPQLFTYVFRSREETAYDVKPLTTAFPQYVVTWTDDVVQSSPSSLQLSRAERVRARLTQAR